MYSFRLPQLYSSFSPPPSGDTVNNQVLYADNQGNISWANTNASNGVCQLDSGGKVSAANLPSYVDDVLEFANFAAFPSPGETGKIYVADNNGFCYRWSGSSYIQIANQTLSKTGTSNTYVTDTGATINTAYLTSCQLWSCAMDAASSISSGCLKSPDKWNSDQGGTNNTSAGYSYDATKLATNLLYWDGSPGHNKFITKPSGCIFNASLANGDLTKWNNTNGNVETAILGTDYLAPTTTWASNSSTQYLVFENSNTTGGISLELRSKVASQLLITSDSSNISSEATSTSPKITLTQDGGLSHSEYCMIGNSGLPFTPIAGSNSDNTLYINNTAQTGSASGITFAANNNPIFAITTGAMILGAAPIRTSGAFQFNANSVDYIMGDGYTSNSVGYYANNTKVFTLNSTGFVMNAGILNMNNIPLVIPDGTNKYHGQIQLNSGTATVNTNKVNTNSRIQLTLASLTSGSAVGGSLAVSTINSTVSFTIRSSNGSDDSYVNWVILQVA